MLKKSKLTLLKESIKRTLEDRHSPAGKKYLAKIKEIKQTRLSRQSKRQLGHLPDADYKLVMDKLRRKK